MLEPHGGAFVHSNSDWTDDISGIPGFSAYNSCPIRYCTFSWRIQSVDCCGFFAFTHSDEKLKYRAKIAFTCMGIAEQKNPSQTQRSVSELLEELRRECSGSPTSNQGPQFGLILRHDGYLYTGTLGCQVAMWPSVEVSCFSLTISVDVYPQSEVSPNMVVVLVSNGLLQYLADNNCPRPITRIMDEFRESVRGCTDNYDKTCHWTMDRIENSYGKVSSTYEAVFLGIKILAPQIQISAPEVLKPAKNTVLTIPSIQTDCRILIQRQRLFQCNATRPNPNKVLQRFQLTLRASIISIRSSVKDIEERKV
ncbi:Oidioi.mRNA.OKI2018_I69.XSR.g15758.t1.cds [Oikopleura dioica]|uniref:Oidioi.mRNA.OKI2018_I69.XSR.g15758.t1.cds n=1 Tax=Oikopleura dioica TaxID=34765 RepID=A0ABN7SIZ3_OIKDI|nr:Oidioi.mRNA.OKI2018_I69.XSR.g15758.t1.cds [Oikopleura dioica]